MKINVYQFFIPFIYPVYRRNSKSSNVINKNVNSWFLFT